MDMDISKEDAAEVIGSLKRFFREEFEIDLSELQSQMALKYFMKEVAPIAYNRGVADAEAFLRSRLEDLSSSCFEQPLTYWSKMKKH
jgi:uncharacterized protein (DUF2164 family)